MAQKRIQLLGAKVFRRMRNLLPQPQDQAALLRHLEDIQDDETKAAVFQHLLECKRSEFRAMAAMSEDDWDNSISTIAFFTTSEEPAPQHQDQQGQRQQQQQQYGGQQRGGQGGGRQNP